MKLVLKTLPLIAILTFFGCKDKLTSIDIDHSSTTAEFVIAEGTKKGEVDKAEALNYDLNQLAKDNGVNPDNFKALKLKSLKATINNDATFEPLDKVIVKFSADGIGEKTIATKDPVNGAGVKLINFDIDNNLDLLPYFKSGSLKVHLVSTLNSDITKEVIISIEAKYVITAGL